MYKTYIETKHENHDHLDPSEMGQASYLLAPPRISIPTRFIVNIEMTFCGKLHTEVYDQNVIYIFAVMCKRAFIGFTSRKKTLNVNNTQV